MRGEITAIEAAYRILRAAGIYRSRDFKRSTYVRQLDTCEIKIAPDQRGEELLLSLWDKRLICQLSLVLSEDTYNLRSAIVLKGSATLVLDYLD